MNAMPCRYAPGHVVHHIPVSLLYWPWKSDVLKICTPAMQKAFLFQKWMFYARPRASAPLPPSSMWPLIVIVWVPVAVLGLVLLLCPQNAYFCSFMCITFAYVFFSIHSKASFRMHFYSVKKAAHFVAPRGLVVGLRQSRTFVPTICLFC